MSRLKLIRTATIPMSLDIFCKGILQELSTEYEVIAVSSPGKELDDIAARERVRTIGVPMKRQISLWHDFISLCRLVRLFRQERPAIVHSMTPKAGLLSMLAAWLTKVPVRIHTFTGLVFPTATGLKQKILILTDRITAGCATHVIPEGQGVMNDLYTYHITTKPMHVLGYGNVRGVDLSYFQPNTNKKSDATYTFLFVGRIVADKGVNELIEAFVNHHKQYPSSRLIMVGPYEDAQKGLTVQTVEQIQHHPAITHYNFTQDVRPYYATADCLILPSYREGFPNVVLEAGAMELPAIVTDINGSREIITDKQNGLIVPTHSAIDLERAMAYMQAHPKASIQMGKMARKNIEERFEQSFVRSCLYNYYHEILKESCFTK